MKQQAMRTAMALYENGTLDLHTAANQAGVPADSLRRAVDRTGATPPTASAENDRIRVHAD